MARMAEAMLRTLGGCEVRLLLALPQETGAELQRLALSSVDAEEVSCSPVVVRTLSLGETEPTHYEVLFSAAAILALAETRGVADPDSLFTTARGLMCGDKRLRIDKVTSEAFAGTPYLYRITATELQ
jgi:hypothetical protein